MINTMPIPTTPAVEQDIYGTPPERFTDSATYIMRSILNHSEEATFHIDRPYYWRFITQDLHGCLVRFDDGAWIRNHQVWFPNERINGVRISIKIDPHPLLDPPSGTARPSGSA